MNSIITGNGTNLEPYSNSIEKKPNLAQGSRFSSRIARRYSQELELLGTKGIDLCDFEGVFNHLVQTHPNDVALRVMRQLVLHQLLIEDCQGKTPLEEVMERISDLADFTLLMANKHVNAELQKLHGRPSNSRGEHSDVAIIAMGKLGAKELNVSSDVDLVYVYDEDGQTIVDRDEGQKIISNQEYYLKWAKAMHKQIGEVTEHGFVFRVDLALRPYGNSSASALSIGALDDYFQKTARPWERFAWLKARVITSPKEQLGALEKKIYTVVESYVFRPYVDFQLMESLREIHQKIQIQAEKNKDAHDIKLGRGGIREIEFGVQLFQVTQGGARAELRTRSTLKAIKYLQKYKLLSDQQAKNWEMAYRYLRTIEHRIQYLDDQQTHKLPVERKDVAWIAETMGYQDSSTLMRDLDAICAYVQSEFDQLLIKPDVSTAEKKGALNEAIKLSETKEDKEDREEKEAKQAKNVKDAKDEKDGLMAAFHELTTLLNLSTEIELENFNAKGVTIDVDQWSSKWVKALGQAHETLESKPIKSSQLDVKRKWLVALIKRCCIELEKGQVKAQDIGYWLEWIDSIFKRDNYLALQVEHPEVQKNIIKLMGASSWCRRYLKYYPSVVEQLVNEKSSKDRFNPNDFIEILNRRRQTQNKNTGIEDEEEWLKLLRREHHASLFKILIADLNAELSVEEVSDDLTALADAVLSVCVDWIWQKIRADKNIKTPPLAIIGYGKLGSKELGYGSDLDLVLLYDEEDAKSSEQMTLLARRLISWVTMKTSDGDLYEIDNALRPNGSSGLLVSSFAAFEKYQRQLDLNSAWTWEHQALTRARFCLGSEALKIKFEKVRKDVLAAKRDEIQLKNDVYEMRHKLWTAQKNKPSQLNGKFSPGGMVDVEFVVQFLILSQSNQFEALTKNIGNIALLKMAEELGILPVGWGDESANAYRHLRKKQHQASLQEANFVLDESDARQVETVKKLWLQYFKPYW